MKLQKRERFLLRFLLLLVVVGGVSVFWVYPLWSAVRVNTTTLQQMEQRAQEAQELIAVTTANEKEIRTLQIQAQQLYSLMQQTSGYDISLLLSDVLARHSLTPTALAITQYEQVPVPVATATAAATDTQPAPSKYAFKRSATLSFTGTDANANAFLDEIGSYNKSMLVDGYTCTKEGETEKYEIRLVLYEFAEPKEATLQANSEVEGTASNDTAA